MKSKNITKKFDEKVAFLLLSIMFLAFGCSDDTSGWADERYLKDYELYVYHTNPNTGLDYTDEELAELSYDPREKESYTEGQQVELSLVTSKRPIEIKILSGTDLSVLESITTVEPFGEKFRSTSFSSSLENLGLVEVGQKLGIKFEVVYEDGSIGAAPFVISRVKAVDPATANYFVYLKKNNGETLGLLTDESVTSVVKDPNVGSIVSFNGTTDKVEVINIPDLDFRYNGDFSIGLWVNTTVDNSDPSIIGDKDWGSGGNPGFVFAFNGDSGWKLNAGDGTSRIDIDGSPINDGNWHFLMATFDRDGNATIYEDGVAVGTADMSGLGSMESGYPIRLAQDGTGAYGVSYEGKLGETYIYDYVLTPEQVEGISTIFTGVQLKTQAGIVKNIPLTNNGAQISNENGLFAYTFNGVDQYATIDNSELSFRYNSDYSISFWVNTTSADSDPVMIGDQDWNSSNNDGLTIAFRGNNWRVAISDGEGNKADTDFNGGFNDGQWHLLTVVFDRDANMTMYQDGKEVASASMAAVGDTESGNPLRLAQDGTSNYGQFFEGKIAGTVIYDYALSNLEVASLFN